MDNRKNLLALAGASVLAVAAQSAHAAIDIAADVTAAKAEISTAGGLIVGVMVAVAVIFWIRRVIK